jgi:L-2-hydroxyglutarate oxidase LhgO
MRIISVSQSKIMYDFVIIGGGIVGLSTGMILRQRFPKASMVILEKERPSCCSSNRS